jgi:adenylate cyclase
MILGRFVSRPDWTVGLERTLILVLGLVLLALLPRLGAVKGALLGLALAAAVLGGSWYGFHRYRVLIDPIYPVLAVLAVYVTQTVLTYYREERRRSYIHQAFDRYLSPEMVRRIAADPGQLELGGEERQMTVLFCDVRNFSRISERMQPQDIIRFLIALLTPMCDILMARRATIDKFIGDAILAFWNAPLDDPQQYEHAARAALEMVERLKRLNAEMAADRGEPWPGEVRIGIGLNAGPCCVGNMGSAQRLSYSLIGDTVNLASRIEGLTKLYGVEIALGSALRCEIGQFATLPIDLVRVVGREAAEEISVLIGDEQVAGDPAFQSFAAVHCEMIAAYRAMDWESALARLDEGTAGAREFGLDKVHALYRERIAGLRQHPPDGTWDGVFTATEK